MGTRNLTCVFVNGEYKVAQYCQWDGYPSGQGLTILNFLLGKPTVDSKDFYTNKNIYNIGGVVYDKNIFLEALNKSRFITEEEI